MNLLFYIRLVPGEEADIVKHPDYRNQEELCEGRPVFFETLSPVRMISRRVSLNRIDGVIESLHRTLPHVSKTMELIDRNNSRMKSQHIYMYLGLGDTGVICAFATLDRLNHRETCVQDIFDQIEAQVVESDALFSSAEESPRPYKELQSPGGVML